MKGSCGYVLIYIEIWIRRKQCAKNNLNLPHMYVKTEPVMAVRAFVTCTFKTSVQPSF